MAVSVYFCLHPLAQKSFRLQVHVRLCECVCVYVTHLLRILENLSDWLLSKPPALLWREIGRAAHGGGYGGGGVTGEDGEGKTREA